MADNDTCSQTLMYSCNPFLFSVTVLRCPNKYNITQVMDDTAEISYKGTWFHLGHCLGLSDHQLLHWKPTESPRGEETRLASNDMTKLGSGSSEVCQKNLWINLKTDLQAPVET